MDEPQATWNARRPHHIMDGIREGSPTNADINNTGGKKVHSKLA